MGTNQNEQTSAVDQLYDYLMTSFLLPLFIATLIVNVLNLVVFTRKSFQKVSIGFYLVCLSVSDILEGTVMLLEYDSISTYILTQSNKSNFLCRLFASGYVRNTFQYFPSWILAIMSVERLINIKFVKVSHILKQTKIKITIVLVPIVLLIFVNIDLIIGSSISRAGICRNEIGYFNIQIIPGFDQWYVTELKSIFILALIPFLIMTISNTISINTLYQSRKRFTLANKSRKEFKFAFTTLGLNLTFFIFNVPQYVVSIFIGFLIFKLNNSSNNANSLRLVGNIYYYEKINRILYSFRLLFLPCQVITYLLFNSVYREEILTIFRLNKCKAKKPIKNQWTSLAGKPQTTISTITQK